MVTRPAGGGIRLNFHVLCGCLLVKVGLLRLLVTLLVKVGLLRWFVNLLHRCGSWELLLPSLVVVFYVSVHIL